MITFARAPGTTGWVEIKPEEELSNRGQFWEIRKFAVESDGIMPLARRLDRAEQALRAAGFQYHGPSEKWLAPKAPGRGTGHVLVACAAWLKTPPILAADPELASAFAADLLKIRYELKGLE